MCNVTHAVGGSDMKHLNSYMQACRIKCPGKLACRGVGPGQKFQVRASNMATPSVLAPFGLEPHGIGTHGPERSGVHGSVRAWDERVPRHVP